MKPMPNEIGDTMPEIDPHPDPLDLEAFLPYRLSVLSNRISNAIARVYARRFGLTIPEWRLMAVVGRFGPMSANGAAERTAMDKVRVSRAVQRLLKSGLLERDTDAQDRRRSVLKLTPKGVAIRSEIAPLARSIEQRLLAPMSDEERTIVERAVALLERGADKFLAPEKGKARSSSEG